MISKININIKNRTKNNIIECNLTDAALSILRETELSGIVEIDLTICSELYIKKLNSKYRNIDKPTDVLSFPTLQLFRGKAKKDAFPLADGQMLLLGDIIICYSVVMKQAKEQHHSIEEEFYHLFTHGVKHLVGFHHKED